MYEIHTQHHALNTDHPHSADRADQTTRFKYPSTSQFPTRPTRQSSQTYIPRDPYRSSSAPRTARVKRIAKPRRRSSCRPSLTPTPSPPSSRDTPRFASLAWGRLSREIGASGKARRRRKTRLLPLPPEDSSPGGARKHYLFMLDDSRGMTTCDRGERGYVLRPRQIALVVSIRMYGSASRLRSRGGVEMRYLWPCR